MNNISNQMQGLRTVYSGNVFATAAGTGDATAVTGATIDTQFTVTGKGGNAKDILAKASSVKFSLTGKTTLTAAKTLSIACEYQESSDGSTWDTAVALLASTVVKTGAVTDSAITPLEYNLSLESKKRYIRFNFTPDLSHTSSDTAVLSAIAILQADTLPITR